MPRRMTVGTLPAPEVKTRLQGDGLGLRIGSLGMRILSRMPAIHQGLPAAYADYPVLELDEFADFRVRIDAPPGPRRWIRPQAQFYLGTTAPFLPLPAHHALAMLEWGMNWCVSSGLHRYLVIHAAAAEKDGLTYLFPGESGSGKSTLVASLMLSGWRLLTDELVLLDAQDGSVQPFPRPVGLKNDAIAIIQRAHDHAVVGHQVRDTTKGLVAHLRPDADSIRRGEERGTAAGIFFPRFRRGATADFTPRAPHETFLALVNQSFNYQILGESGFRLASSLVTRVPAYDLQYGTMDDGKALIRQLHAQIARQ